MGGVGGGGRGGGEKGREVGRDVCGDYFVTTFFGDGGRERAWRVRTRESPWLVATHNIIFWTKEKKKRKSQ